jgi:hypothetical protein
MGAAIIGFLVNSTAIFAGAKLAKQQEVNFIQCLAVALVSIATVFIARLVLLPLALVPFLGGLAMGVACWLGTAAAAKFVLNLEWRPALMIGAAAAIIQTVLLMLLH